MGILEKERRILKRMIDFSYRLGQYYGEKRKIKDERRTALLQKINYTSEQTEKIDAFYMKNYGKKIPYDWHRLYQSYTGKFDEQYFPEIIFSSVFEPTVNPEEYRYVLDDKLLLNVFCHGIDNVRTPEVFGTFCNGVFWGGDNIAISKKCFLQRLSELGNAIIKPVQDTSSGQGVLLVNIIGGIDTVSGKTLECLIGEYKGAFQIQEVIKPHRSLKNLYPNAVNTFRIVTYIWNGEVHYWPVTLRIGQGGSYLDNAHAGGMFIAVNDNGSLSSKAFTEFQMIYEMHPDTKIVFKDYNIPFVMELIQCAKKMHLNTPQLGVISWDLTIDENDKFVLIEANTRGQTIWFPQMASGKAAFGADTEEILRFLSKKEYYVNGR